MTDAITDPHRGPSDPGDPGDGDPLPADEPGGMVDPALLVEAPPTGGEGARHEPPTGDADATASAERVMFDGDLPATAEIDYPESFSQRVARKITGLTVENWITFAIVAACVIGVFAVLKPQNLLSDTTPAGGDMGAHVWAPAYLRDNLLTKGRLTGWTPDWYAGFPAFHFYMIIPSLVIALLSLVIPYGVAFKLVAVSGVVTLPFSAYFFGRMARLPFPAPPLLAVAGTFFLFDRSFSIYGGNIPSTLAGEFAFSISLSIALLYLGVVARGLETGKHRGWAAILLAMTGLCHLIPFIFVVVATFLLFALRPGLRQLQYLATMAPVGVALTAFWMLPFYLRSGYMNDMGWEKILTFREYLWDREKLDQQLINVPDLKWVIAFAAVGLLLSLVYRRRAGVFLALLAATFAIGFVIAPQGRLWNARLLPFYYLSLYLLAAVGVAELGRLLAALFAPDVNKPLRWITCVTPIVGGLFVYVALAMSLQMMPLASTDPDGGYRLGPIVSKDRSFVDSWSNWNFEGYEGSTTLPSGQVQYKKSWPEYYAVTQTMKQLGETKGCGRAMWEHEENHDRYGTPMALMLLPFWTEGCIGSMEGLYFEASTTTPYHFLNQDQLSYGPSNAQRDLPYGAGPPTQADFDLGVKHLQMMGVKYYMAINDITKGQAAKNASLAEVATSGPWKIYEVKDAPLVEALPYEPAVITGQDTQHRPWQDTSVCWYQNESNWDVVLVADGPSSWQRKERNVPVDTEKTAAEQCNPAANWGWYTTDGAPELRSQKPVTVSNVVTSDDGISFDVSEPGVPVLVKMSYFPNFKASGAEGPYRATPNFMVVVPTSNHVELSYGWTGIDLLSIAITLMGLVGLVFLFRASPVPVKPPGSFWGKAERPDLYPTGGDLRFEHGYEQDQARALAAIVPEAGMAGVPGLVAGVIDDDPTMWGPPVGPPLGPVPDGADATSDAAPTQEALFAPPAAAPQTGGPAPEVLPEPRWRSSPAAAPRAAPSESTPTDGSTASAPSEESTRSDATRSDAAPTEPEGSESASAKPSGNEADPPASSAPEASGPASPAPEGP